MKPSIKKQSRGMTGQAATEYVLALALVVIAMAATVSLFPDALRTYCLGIVDVLQAPIP